MAESCDDTLPPKPGSDTDIFRVCPVARAFEITGSKWRLTVLRCLHLWGEQRFSELQETSTADSATLSRVLGDLEERNLVDRRRSTIGARTGPRRAERSQTETRGRETERDGRRQIGGAKRHAKRRKSG